MDKPSERKKDSKAEGDTDIGIHKFGPDNVRASLPTIWDHAPKEVVGLPLDRLITNCYSKAVPGEKRPAPDLIDEIVNGGPPFANVSVPKRIL